MKGIIFSEPMFNAVIDGRKTQTRRIMTPQPKSDLIAKYHCNPRYKAGEIVYLKEPYLPIMRTIYKYDGGDYDPKLKWKNKLFMMERYARYFIEITAVRCERLQDISDDDCLKEGIEELNAGEIIPNYQDYIQYSNGDEYNYDTPQKAYAALINKIYGKGTWESNPYVWVYDFKLTIKN